MLISMNNYGGGFQALHQFDNGYGASVIKNRLTMGQGYELAMIQWMGDYDWDFVYIPSNAEEPIEVIFKQLLKQEVDSLLVQIESNPESIIDRFRIERRL